MSLRYKLLIIIVALQFCADISAMLGQQKPQWVPGQVGLNAGIMPSPGFTYVNTNINYDAGAFNNQQGNAVQETCMQWQIRQSVAEYPAQLKTQLNLGGRVSAFEFLRGQY